MRITNNIPAINVFNALNSTNKSLSKTINALSTGLRINSAADDAAGFAISEKLRSQIGGIDTALRNSQDGISLLQTAEGALEQTNSMLQRMRDLAIQASNDSLTSQDRQYLQGEIDELKKQIDQIAGTTQFNKKRILDGSSGALWSASDSGVKARINGGLTRTDNFGQKVSAEGNYKIEVKAYPGQAQVQKSNIMMAWKTETDYGGGEGAGDITETVRSITTHTKYVEEIEYKEERTITKTPYTIYLNTLSDNFVAHADDATEDSKAEIAALQAGWHATNDGVLEIIADGTYNIKGVDDDGNPISTTNRIRVKDGVKANIFLTDVKIDLSKTEGGCPFEVEPGAKANIYLSGTNTLISGYGTSSKGRAALEVREEVDGEGNAKNTAEVMITSAKGDGSESGTLNAISNGWGAGIGGWAVNNGRAGTITINGGTITADSSKSAGAGIGSGETGPGAYDGGGTITINGGNITASGSNSGAGIGTAYAAGFNYNAEHIGDDGTKITITGGTIKAKGASRAADIGGGGLTNSGVIRIKNGLQGMLSGMNIGKGARGKVNDVEYVDDLDFTPGEVPAKADIVKESIIKIPVVKKVPVTEAELQEITRTVTVVPPPGLENKLDEMNLGDSVDTLIAKGMPAGDYNIRTLNAPLTSPSFQLTGSYGTDPSGLVTLNQGSGSLTTNANILFEVTGVNKAEGTVTLKATANLISTDGKATKHIVREGLILKEGESKALAGLNLNGDWFDLELEEANPAVEMNLAAGAASLFSEGDKFVYNIVPSGFSIEERTFEISGTQASDWSERWGDNVTDQPLLYGLNAFVQDSEVTFTNFYLSSKDGTVYEGDIVLNTNGNLIENDSNIASFTASREEPVTTTKYVVADEDTKLSEVGGFYNKDGVFILDIPQNITITQGNGKTTTVTLYPTDTIRDVREKLNNAVAYGLGQGQHARADKFVSYVTEESKTVQGLESVPGTFIVRSAVPGKDGELYFSGDDELLHALGLNTIQGSSESTLTASVYDAHSGAKINEMKASSGEFKSIIPPEIDVDIDPMTTSISAKWDENTKRFMFSHSQSYMAFLHLKDNGITFQTGANNGEDYGIQLGDMSSYSLGVSRVNVATRETASRSIAMIDSAISKVSKQRSKVGSYINDMEYIMNNLTTASANLTSADSRLRDADMAKTMMNFVRHQILNQAGTSMLAQANQIPQSVLTLMQN